MYIFRKFLKIILVSLMMCFAITKEEIGFEDIESLGTLNETPSSREEAEDDNSEFDGDIWDGPALVNFAKSCLIQILHREIPDRCVNPKVIKSLAKKIGVHLGDNTKVENLEFFVGDDQLCYSYNLATAFEKPDKRIKNCFSATEVIDFLFKWLFTATESKEFAKIDQEAPPLDRYCFSPALIKVATVFISALIGSFIYISSILWSLFKKNSENHTIKNLSARFDAMLLKWYECKNDLRDIAKVLEQRWIVARAKITVELSNLPVENIKKEISEALIKAVSILLRFSRILKRHYQCLAENSHFHITAEKFASTKVAEQYKHGTTSCLQKLLDLQRISRCKKSKYRRGFKLNYHLKEIMSDKAEVDSVSSFATIDVQSCTGSSVLDGSNGAKKSLPRKNDESFEILRPTTDDFLSIQTMLSDASSDQPSKTPPSSQWDLNICDIMLDLSPDLCKERKGGKPQQIISSWSNSSYEIIALTESESETVAQKSIGQEEQLPSLSISSCSLDTTALDQRQSQESSTVTSSVKKPTTPKEYQPSSPSSTYSGICLNFNSCEQSNSPEDIGTRCPFTSGAKSNDPWLGKQKAKHTDRFLNQTVWPNKLVNVVQNTTEKLSTNVPFVSGNQEQNYVYAPDDGWPIKDPHHDTASVWDKTRDVPVLNSVKKSFLTESSFNFDDSRFNSFSPETSRYPTNRKMSAATDMKSNEMKEGLLCDFSHILKLPGNYEEFSDKTINANEDNPGLDPAVFPHFGAQIPPIAPHQQDLELNSFSVALPALSQSICGRKDKSIADQFLQVIKTQRDEINNLRLKVARDALVLAEHRGILGDLSKEYAIRSQTIHKRLLNKLTRAQHQETFRYNAVLDKRIMKLYRLQRNCNDTRVREFQLKTQLQWKPFERK